MTIKFKKASQKELAKMNIDAEDFAAVETVEVNGQAVGTFATTEEGWGCQYIDGKTGQTLDFGDADYSDAKSRLRKMVKTIYADAEGDATDASEPAPVETSADEKVPAGDDHKQVPAKPKEVGKTISRRDVVDKMALIHATDHGTRGAFVKNGGVIVDADDDSITISIEDGRKIFQLPKKSS